MTGAPSSPSTSVAAPRRIRPAAAGTVAVLALLATGLLLGLVGQATHQTAVTDDLPEGYDATRVAALLEEVPSSDSAVAVTLFVSDDGELDRAQLAELERAQQSLGPGNGAPLRVSEDGTAALGVVPVDARSATDVAAYVEDLRERVDAAAPEGVTALVTGPAAIQADLAGVFEGADFTLLLTTAAIVAVLLVVTYRSPLLWVVPLLVVGAADQVAAVAATHVLAVFDIAWNESTVGILSVLVFGAGTDYALLLISRYRDELRLREDRFAAMAVAVRSTTEAVLASSTTVVLGLLTLLLSVVPTTRGLGLACAVGVAIAAFTALVVLPRVLVLFGRWVFWPIVPRVGQTALVDSRTSLWRRLGTAVSARPGRFAVTAVLLLGTLAAGLTQVRVGLSESEQFLDTPESIVAADRIVESFPAGTTDPTVVLTRDDAEEVRRDAAAVDGVASAQVGTQADGLARVDVVLADRSGSDGAERTVRDLREAMTAHDRTLVGGTEAQAIDSDDGAARDQRLIIPLILVLVLVGLAVLLRSAVAPLLLVATVVGTYFAALGASWWIYTQVFGFAAMDVTVPLFAFLFLVALGVDYNIFLVSRAAEEARRHGLREGMLRGLTATGGVITSAGILLAAVFAALGVLPLVVLAQLGIVIFVGVLLDTLVVRTVLVPALAWRLGDRFWWPRRITSTADAD
ncbi:MMPL family transporter [Nocardioides panacisoli]|uniref:MMPL family transporter n=1 Tax=Nocardioides panacisoli TaxID=627624 RepID=UPI001C63369D|nr:MMPL family transporter [Nocardioides panacisoli]QYJ03354.1 MMPL family transporter [Nocardioides panacisoli]